jgi:hypothetical protein
VPLSIAEAQHLDDNEEIAMIKEYVLSQRGSEMQSQFNEKNVNVADMQEHMKQVNENANAKFNLGISLHHKAHSYGVDPPNINSKFPVSPTSVTLFSK